jgi:hypothetical protein
MVPKEFCQAHQVFHARVDPECKTRSPTKFGGPQIAGSEARDHLFQHLADVCGD